MDSDKLNDRFQILGMTGIIASLVFVGLELRQSRQIAIADVYQQRAGLAIQVQNSQAANDRLLDIFGKIRPRHLAESEQCRQVAPHANIS